MSTNRTFKLKSNALIFTIVFSLILSIISLALIMTFYYKQQIEIQNEISEKLSRNLNSGVEWVLSNSLSQASSFNDKIDLFGKGEDSVTASFQPWGIYKSGCITASSGRFNKSISFLFGTPSSSYLNSCVYLADHDRPLSVVGNTHLIGDAYLPKAGIRTAYIDKRGFNLPKMIYGSVRTSEKELPAIGFKDLEYLENLTYLKNHSFTANSPILDTIVSRSFFDSTLTMVSSKEIDLKKYKLSGKIVVCSEKKIIASAESSLENIILIAPSVNIEDGFRGKLQIIATDSINIGKNCHLDYPSALILVKNNWRKTINTIEIKYGSTLSGAILSICDGQDIYKSVVSIEENTMVKGLIYVNGHLSLKGVIYGSVLADYFLFKTSSTAYENHLVDTEINRQRLSSYFIFPSIFSNSIANKVAEWVN